MHAWKVYGYTNHIQETSIFFLFLLLSSYTNYTFNKTNLNENSVFERSEKTLIVTEICLLLYFVVKWLLVNGLKHRPFAVFSRPVNLFLFPKKKSFWHEVLFLLWFTLFLFGSILRLRNGIESDTSSFIISAATIAQYLLAISFLRPFKSFGWTIGIIESILLENINFVLFVFIIIFGFSQALYLNAWSGSNYDDGFGFGTPGGSLAQGFVLFVGNPSISTTDSHSPNKSFSIFLEIMLVSVGSILLLNILIALMNGTYNRLVQSNEAEWLRQLCRTIAYQTSFLSLLIPERDPDKFIHFLKRQIDIDRDFENREKQNEINDLKALFQKELKGLKELIEKSSN